MTKSLHTIIANLIPSNKDINDIAISGIKLDSTQIEQGDLFIAISGSKFDGHDFIQDAIKAGASAVISNGRDMGKLSIPQIIVANPRRAASIVAAEFYGHPTKELTIVGITGTNGKTTTASLLYSILKEAGHKVAQLGTLGLIGYKDNRNASLTTLDSVSLQNLFSELRDADFSHIVMEVSSHALDQYRVADVDFNVAVFTNLTPEHLDYHATLESYYQAKAKLFRMLPMESTAIANGSDPNGTRILTETSAPYLIFSNENGTSIHFSECQMDLSGIRGTVSAGQSIYNINSNLIGGFNCENILAAVSSAHALGINQEAIENGIENCLSIPGRMESFQLASGGTAIIDYAHTPDAYEKVLGTIKKLNSENGNIFVVFGAGGDRDSGKRPQMARIAELFATYCFITPDNPRMENPDDISKEVVTGFADNNFAVFTDRGLGLHKALKQTKRKDIIVIFGKGREEYQDIMGEKEFYSDLNILKEYL